MAPSLPRKPKAIENPQWVREDPKVHSVPPPVAKNEWDLPFLKIDWQDFERLCRRLASVDDEVEATWAYGVAGQKQYGIDILVRMKDRRYSVWQTKRYRSVKPGDIKAAVEIFLDHTWSEKASRFVLAYACSIQTTGVIDAIESATVQLHQKGIDFVVYGSDRLSEELLKQPEIVDDFFGRAWVLELCPPEALERLADRLSVYERNSLRLRLRSIYESWVASVDPGLPIANLGRLGEAIKAPPLRERFIEPDVLIEARHLEIRSELQAQRSPRTGKQGESFPEAPSIEDRREHSERVTIGEYRTTLSSFLGSGRQFLVVGDPGSGKTTLLRALAIDILADVPILPSMQQEFAGWLPVWIPFPLWTRMASKAELPPSIEAVVRAFFEALGDEPTGDALALALRSGKVLLLVDGLDEAVDRLTTKTVASLLHTFTESRNIPVILTTRPHGLDAMGTLPANWKRATIAPLNPLQQSALAEIWFRILAEHEDQLPRERLDGFAQTRTRAFLESVASATGLSPLSTTPLFLLALLALHRQGKSLPNSRMAAVGEIIAQLVEHQPERRGINALQTGRTGPHQRQRDRILDDFAYRLHSRQFNSRTPDSAPVRSAVDAAVDLLTKRQPDMGADRAEDAATEIFLFAHERAGILARKPGDEIGFLHLSFQEYLAARSLVHRPFPERVEFAKANAMKLRWREPLLYLLHQTNSESEVQTLLTAICEANCEDDAEQSCRDALIVDAVFSDLAHDVPSVSKIAEELFREVETCATGRRLSHLLRAIVDGLNSEALGGRCREQLEEWVPNRYSWHRSGALQAMKNWPRRYWPQCAKVLVRSLYADEDATRRAAAETLGHIVEFDDRWKLQVQSLASSASSPSDLASLLCALRFGWPHDDHTGVIASAARSSEHLGVALEAIKIRAARNETDAIDFRRFFDFLSGDRAMSDADLSLLVEHFAENNGVEFGNCLREAIRKAMREDNLSRNKAMVLSLAACAPDDPELERLMLKLLGDEFSFRDLFEQGHALLSYVKWTPTMVAAVHARMQSDKVFSDYEFYWVSKHVHSEMMKAYFIKNLREKRSLKFWSAQALVEVWGGDDPEVQGALAPFLQADAHQLALVAHALPAVVNDAKACRAAFIRALSNSPKRVDLLLQGLQAIGVDEEDDELFAAVLAAREGLKAELWEKQWKVMMISLFPARSETQNLVTSEIESRDGCVDTIADVYASDETVIRAVLRLLAPLPHSTRLTLVATLNRVASGNATAFKLLQGARADSDGGVSSEATLCALELMQRSGAVDTAEVDHLADELHSVGTIHTHRRAAATIGLAIAGKFEVANAATRFNSPMDFGIGNLNLYGDDRYLRRVHEIWPQLVISLGSPGAVLDRLGMTVENTLGALDPIHPNAREVYDALLARLEKSRYVNRGKLLATMALFEPSGIRLRIAISQDLLASSGLSQAATIAAGIAAEQFSGDQELEQLMIERFRQHPESAVAGAIAEIAYQRQDDALADEIFRQVEGFPRDIITNLRLYALLAEAPYLVERLTDIVSDMDLESARYQSILWPASLLDRVKNDAQVYVGLARALDLLPSATAQVTLAALLAAVGSDEHLQEAARDVLVKERTLVVPRFGQDMATGRVLSVRQQMIEIIAA